MDVRHLELLRELSVRGTLAAVAQATHRTPSAVSQQLKTAERELRVPLVEPYARGVRLTDAGRILAEGADEVLAALAEVRARLEASRGEPSGVVRIGTLPSAGEALLPGLVAACGARRSTWRWRISTSPNTITPPAPSTPTSSSPTASPATYPPAPRR
ncbi:DNA-binding transcriptional LysR family regulator [Kineosphaera limosa]|uniref:Putative LysR family transcriptional regulator n=1 Tax=Kineosphaera limosa NBRC 100340 TaxID=1184609 RepID=K6WC45_9MICO|nr:LysR family transcriptional regulator [Kineosphaera limosa]NYE00711.1 DNA-binding transcriptional LysR family regulator [Kineosphaera limosa]GAB96800.1 putative LysR family transcriptional regulator [Kineosphaera limosa NBRC 100340]